MGCSYSSEELDYWYGVTNPMGSECNECGEWECEHNLNASWCNDYGLEEDVLRETEKSQP